MEISISQRMQLCLSAHDEFIYQNDKKKHNLGSYFMKFIRPASLSIAIAGVTILSVIESVAYGALSILSYIFLGKNSRVFFNRLLFSSIEATCDGMKKIASLVVTTYTKKVKINHVINTETIYVGYRQDYQISQKLDRQLPVSDANIKLASELQRQNEEEVIIIPAEVPAPILVEVPVEVSVPALVEVSDSFRLEQVRNEKENKCNVVLIETGAKFLLNHVLSKKSKKELMELEEKLKRQLRVFESINAKELASFESIDAAIVLYIMTKSLYIYAIGKKNREEIPGFFGKKSIEEIIKLRKEAYRKDEIELLEKKFKNLENFEKSFANKDKNFMQLQEIVLNNERSGMLVIKCWPKALQKLEEERMKIN